MPQKIGRYMNPVIAAIKRLGGSARPAEVCAAVSKDLQLEGSPFLDEKLKSGVSKFENKIAWVRQYLVTSGYIDRSKRGVWTLTDKGRSVSKLSDQEISEILLKVQRQPQESHRASGTEVASEGDSEESEVPEESGYKSQLLGILRGLPPAGFERLCQRLLRESGFEQVTVTGKTGDGGIDGIGVLRVNHFVAFKVLFQCKKYVSAVSPSEVRDFRGAMQGRADKGLILTTGSFSAAAMKEAVRDGVPPIELVDGDQMIELFERLELGLRARTTYDIELGFFTEFQT